MGLTPSGSRSLPDRVPVSHHRIEDVTTTFLPRVNLSRQRLQTRVEQSLAAEKLPCDDFRDIFVERVTSAGRGEVIEDWLHENGPWKSKVEMIIAARIAFGDLREQGLSSKTLTRAIDCNRHYAKEFTRYEVDDTAVVARTEYAARQEMNADNTSESVFKTVRSRDDECVWCGATESGLEFHHIIPLNNGGETVPENLALLCPTCHRSVHETAYRSNNRTAIST